MHRALSAHGDIDLTVLFCSDWGVRAYRDPGFGRAVQWDTPLLEGYRYQFLHNWSVRPGLDRFWGVINPDVIKAIASRRYDAILIYGWARATNWLAWLAAVATRTPIILRGESNLLNSSPPIRKMIKIAVLKTLFSLTAGFLSIGRYNTEFYRRMGVGAEKIYLGPYAVDNEFWQAQAEKLCASRSGLKRQLGFAEELPLILFCGKLIEVKRPFDLLLAFERISRKLACGLVFVGDGILSARLKKYAREHNLLNTRFLGFKNQTEMPSFYAAADIFVLPSANEPWGLVVNEAMCFGLPVVAADKVGATADLVRDGVNGFVYPAGDVDRLVECVERLLINPALRMTAGEASRRL
ncbi:MAG: glycosyltransferase family 4 protein, partial [Acidobacteria bacterium]|nr:glycosyltransferase family 4 protein [Acidobacteriota bacterium]